MPPMAGAPQALRRLSKEGVRIRIITHRLFIKYFHQIAVSQTIQWLDRHDIPYWDLCFMQQKTAVGADLYIEDSPANIERLRAEGQKTIVFTNSTNEHLPGPRATIGTKCWSWCWPRSERGNRHETTKRSMESGSGTFTSAERAFGRCTNVRSPECVIAGVNAVVEVAISRQVGPIWPSEFRHTT